MNKWMNEWMNEWMTKMPPDSPINSTKWAGKSHESSTYKFLQSEIIWRRMGKWPIGVNGLPIVAQVWVDTDPVYFSETCGPEFFYSALAMGGYSFWNQAEQFPTHQEGM